MTGGSGRYLLAIDAGTGSCRALLFTAAGEQVAASACGSGPTASRPDVARRPGLRRRSPTGC